MDVKQLYQFVNTATKEVLGETAVVNEDLSNLVDIGSSVINANALDAYAKALVNHIGKVIFVNRAYRGGVPSVLMDGWEYGSILEKVTAELPEATENESWDLQDGQVYEQNQFYKPTVTVKFYNSKITFEIPLSVTELQLKQSFSSAQQLNGFLSMLYNEVEKSLTIKIDGLIMRTINNFIGETLYAEVPGGTYSGRTGAKAVNLLYMYNQANGTSLTASACLSDKDFIRYASWVMKVYLSRLTKVSTVFNIGGKARFTPSDLLHVVLLEDFASSADVFLQSETFHNELSKLPKYESVPYWQGSGTDYGFGSITKIDVGTSTGHTVTTTGILGVMFDRDALGVRNPDRRVTTHYNAKAEFWNNWYKFDAQYFNDLNENFVVFYVA